MEKFIRCVNKSSVIRDLDHNSDLKSKSSADGGHGTKHFAWDNVFKVCWINPLKCFFDIEGHVALDINPGPGYNTLLLRLILGDLLNASLHRQFHTLPGLFRQWGCTFKLLP